MTPLLFVLLIAPADPKDPPAPRSSPITREQADFLTMGKDKLTLAQLVARLGPPDHYQHADLTTSFRIIADVQLGWTDSTFVEVQHKGRKLVSVTAEYEGHLPLKDFGPEQVLRLKVGMAAEEGDKILGGRGSATAARYFARNRISSSIHNGMHSGYTTSGNFPKADKAAPPVKRPLLSKELAESVKKGTAVADLLKRLGRPDRIELPHDGSRGPKGTAVLTWVEAAEIVATFQKGKTVRLEGRFHPHLSHARVTPDAFRKLNHGSGSDGGKTPKEVQDLLGAPASETKEKDGRTERRYGARRTVEAFIDGEGKVAAVRFGQEPKSPQP